MSHANFGLITAVVLCMNVPAWGQTKETKFLVDKCTTRWSDNGGNYTTSLSFDGDSCVVTWKDKSSSTYVTRKDSYRREL